MRPSCLLVIDVQNAAFDGVRCPRIDQADALLAQISTLLAAFRRKGLPVVFVQHEEGAGEPFEAGTVHAELATALERRSSEPVIKKRQSSAFVETGLKAQLDALDPEALVVCGLQSDYCISNTTKSALAFGYRVQLVSDAHSTWPSEGKLAEAIRHEVNESLAQTGATLVSTESVVNALGR